MNEQPTTGTLLDVLATGSHWHEQAKCAHPASDPRNWDCERTVAGIPPASGKGTGHRAWQRQQAALRLCDGCPVVSLCAGEALDQKVIGVIRAGIALVGVRMTKWQGLALIAIARGVSPAAAVGEHSPVKPPSGPRGELEAGAGIDTPPAPRGGGSAAGGHRPGPVGCDG